MQNIFKWILMLNLLVSAPAFASLNTRTDTAQDRDVQLYLGLMSWSYPGLNAEIADPEANKDEVLSDIQTLDEILRGQSPFEPSQLQTLACKHISCGGDIN